MPARRRHATLITAALLVSLSAAAVPVLAVTASRLPLLGGPATGSQPVPQLASQPATQLASQPHSVRSTHPASVHRVRPVGRGQGWSGYSTSGSPGTFRTISASWTEPAASCQNTSSHFAYFWVGIDGAGNGTVEQAGTAIDCQGGIPSYTAWWEMVPQGPPSTLSDPVSPGDQISAAVAALGGGRYRLTISDASKGWSDTVTKAEPGTENATAEAITEAPNYSLPDFGSVTFSSVLVNGRALASYPLITSRATDEGGTVMDAVGGPADGGTSFTVHYLTN